MSFIDSFLQVNSTNYIKSKNLAKVKPSKHFLNTFFDKIVIINLRRSLARLIKVTSQLKSLGIEYEIFNAIDGQDETIKKEHNQYLQNMQNRSDCHDNHDDNTENNKAKMVKIVRKAGEYAYLLTWIKLLNTGMNQGWNRLLVFEDDVMLCDNFSIKVRDWFGSNDFTSSKVNNSSKKSKNSLLWLLGATQLPHLRNEVERNYFIPAITDGSFAVGLDKALFPFLISEIEKFDGPLDSGALRAAYKRYPKQCYAAFPYLVIAEVDDSTIRGSKDIQEIAAKLEWNLNDFSILKKNQKNLKVALTLYLRADEEHEFRSRVVEELLNEKKVDWSVFLIFKDLLNSSSDLSTNPSTCDLTTINYHPSPVSSWKMAEQIAEQHWSTLRSTNNLKYDRIFFYDYSLKIDDNILKVLSNLV